MLELTSQELDELEQLLLDVVYDPDANESDRNMVVLMDVLSKVEKEGERVRQQNDNR